MLTIFGKPQANGGFRGGVTRRDFLTIGGSLFGGVSLPQLLRAESAPRVNASPNQRSGHKAIINIYLAGGPPHQDMWDIKVDAPREIRGEFNPIHTNVPTIDICELFPHIARMADKFVFIRSLVGAEDRHTSVLCMTGRRDGGPMMGSWVSRLQGPVNQAIPPNLCLLYQGGIGYASYTGGGDFLGMGHNPFNLVTRLGGRERLTGMTIDGVTLDRLNHRVDLLRSFDNVRRQLDQRGVIEGIDAYTQQALSLLTSSRLVDALDLSKEDARVVAAYGSDDPNPDRLGPPNMVRNLCIARRLVEAGARVVTLNFGFWDWHGDGTNRHRSNFVEARHYMPALDQGVAALVSDLHAPVWTKTYPLWSGVNSAARRASTTWGAVITGLGSPVPCLLAAACKPARSSAPPIARAESRSVGRSISRRSLPHSTAISASI